MTKTRILAALVLLPVVVVFVQIGGWFFFTGVTLIALIAIWEYIKMLRIKGHKPSLWVAGATGLAGLLSMQFLRPELFLPTVSLLFVASLIWQLFQADSAASVVDWALGLVGGMYIGLALGHLLGLRLLPQGASWVWLALFCTWGSDTLAYFTGRAIGKHKFWPRLSPKKTWEGIFGGVAGGIIGGLLVTTFADISIINAILVGILVSIIGPLGDLSISMMKRYTGVKDSSHLIPGHGGILDRLDSLLFVAIAVFYYASYLGSQTW